MLKCCVLFSLSLSLSLSLAHPRARALSAYVNIYAYVLCTCVYLSSYLASSIATLSIEVPYLAACLPVYRFLSSCLSI